MSAPIPQLVAPEHWQTVDVLSDMHLGPHDPATFALWARYMATTPAQAVILLGDWFELWVGDDAFCANEPNSFVHRVVQVMQNASERLDLHVMHGNRDFLLGRDMLLACKASLLDDPTVLSFGSNAQNRVLLSHGDALCTSDGGYMAFRAEVRTAKWMQEFLGKPLVERQRIGQLLREQSMQSQATAGTWVDVDPDMSLAWMSSANAPIFIHGHTHEGKTHPLGLGHRWVTLDWHAQPDTTQGAADTTFKGPRAQVLRITRGAGGAAGSGDDGLTVARVDVMS